MDHEDFSMIDRHLDDINYELENLNENLKKLTDVLEVSLKKIAREINKK